MNSSSSNPKQRRDTKKAKLIRSIFEIDDPKQENPKNKNIIKINYDKNIYFQQKNSGNEIAHIITNVLKNPNSTTNINSKSIQVNFNINNNYFNTIDNNNKNNNKLNNINNDNKINTMNNNNKINNNNKTIDIEKLNYTNKNSNSSINSKNTFNKTSSDSLNSINNSLNTIDNEKRNIYKEKATYALLEFKARNSNRGNQFRASTTKNLIKPIKSNNTFSQTIKNVRLPQKIKMENSLNSVNSSIEKNSLLKKEENDNLLKFIPCMNCGNLISFDNIENHSLTCTKVSDEIMKTESSNYQFFNIDYKLKKLKEHLSSILNNKNNNNNNKNNYYNNDNKKIHETEILFLSTILLEYVNEVLQLQKIDLPTIKEIKKTFKNIENISIKYKDNVSDLILIDRTKVLVNEKLKIFKDEYKKEMTIRKNNLTKSGSLKYEEDLKLKIKQLEKINAETELEKNKVKNLRKSAGPANRPKIIKHLISINEKKDESNISNNDINLNLNKVDEIISDVENNSNLYSVNTSFSNISNLNSNEFGRNIFYGNNNNDNCNYLKESSDSFKNNNIEKEVILNQNNYNNKINYNERYNDNNNNNDNNSNNINNKENNNNNNCDYNNLNENDNSEFEKREKRKFFSEVLKIKFEKIHSSHKGQSVNPKFIWEECKRQNIPKNNWNDFILGELNNPYKYFEIQKKDKRSKSRRPPMDVITEEN